MQICTLSLDGLMHRCIFSNLFYINVQASFCLRIQKKKKTQYRNLLPLVLFNRTPSGLV
jgi:hypothetical protein